MCFCLDPALLQRQEAGRGFRGATRTQLTGEDGDGPLTRLQVDLNVVLQHSTSYDITSPVGIQEGAGQAWDGLPRSEPGSPFWFLLEL